MNKDELNTLFRSFSIPKLVWRIYLTLLENGPLKLSNIAKKTNIPLTTTFENSHKALKLGLVKKAQSSGKTIWTAESPLALQAVLSQKDQALIEEQTRLKILEKKLPHLIEKVAANTKIQCLVGSKLLAEEYSKALSSKEIYSFVTLDEYFKVMKNVYKNLDKVAAKNKKLKVKDIIFDTNHSPHFFKKINSKFPNYEYKLISDDIKTLGSDLLIYDDKVLLIELIDKSIFAVKINSKTLATTLTIIHQQLWSRL